MKLLRYMVLLLGVLAGTAHAQITVFPECNFRGTPITLSPGDFDRAALNRAGIFDNDISSIVVSDGYSVTLYDSARFRGRSVEVDAVTSCLQDLNFDNLTTSLSIIEAGSGFEPADGMVITSDEAGIELYTDCDYRGRSARIPVGEYMSRDLQSVGLSDNSISSIRVPKGFVVEIFVNDFQRGHSGKLNQDNKCLVKRFNDTVSSIVVTSHQVPNEPDATGDPIAIVYSECNYRGQTAELRAGDFSANALAALGMPDNAISSLRLAAGVEVQVFENDFFRGGAVAITSNIRCMSGDRFDNTISSVKVIPGDGSSDGGVTQSEEVVDIFADCNYRGRVASFAAGEYTADDLAARGFPDNTISSLKVPAGYRVIGYEHDFYRGGTVDIRNDTDCLSTRRADNAISSLKIEQTEAPEPEQQATLTVAERRALKSGLECVGRYVERDLCSSDAWNVIRDFCSLEDVSLMNDGYLEGHVEQGNCNRRNWKELVRRVSDPSLR